MMDLASLVLRLGLGIMFLAHGLQMALGKLGGPGVAGFSKFLSSLGFQPAMLWSYIASYTVLIGGLFLILGVLTRVSAFFLLIFIVVAALKVHLSKGFFLPQGFEYTFVIACSCIALMLLGPGKYSLMKKF